MAVVCVCVCVYVYVCVQATTVRRLQLGSRAQRARSGGELARLERGEGVVAAAQQLALENGGKQKDGGGASRESTGGGREVRVGRCQYTVAEVMKEGRQQSEKKG